MHAINVNGVPVVNIAVSRMLYLQYLQSIYSNMRNDYAIMLIIFGWLQIVFGVLSIIFGAVSVGIFPHGFSLIGHGIWIGILIIITGLFGILGGKQRNRCHVIAYNVLSVISAYSTTVLLSLGIMSAYLDSYYIDDYSGYYGYGYGYVHKETAQAGVAMESLLVVIAVAEAIVAIWSSVICCKIGACCCDCGSQPLNAPPVEAAMTGQQPYPYIDNGYNQQPQPQIMIAQQPMYQPMAYVQQPVHEKYSYDQ